MYFQEASTIHVKDKPMVFVYCLFVNKKNQSKA